MIHCFIRYAGISILMVLLSCSALHQQLIDNPTVSLEGMTLKNVSLVEFTPVFKFKITNPNPMKLDITKMTYHLSINKKKFVKGVSDKYTFIRAASSDIIELPLSFSPLDLCDPSADSDKAAYYLTGTLQVGPYKHAFQKQGTLMLPKLPKMFLRQIRVLKLSPSESSLSVTVGIENPNPFSVKVSGVEYEIKLGGMRIAQGIAPSLTAVDPSSAVVWDIPLTVYFEESDQTMYEILNASRSDYEFSGNVKLTETKTDERKISFHTAGDITFQR